MPELLSVSRPVSSNLEKRLRRFIPEINQAIPDHLSFKWRTFGRLAMTLLERGEYERALQMQKGSLNMLSQEEILAIVTESLRSLPTAGRMIEAETIGTVYLGVRYPQIAYTLDETSIQTERSHLTGVIDELNGVNNLWRHHIPHVSIASSEVAEPYLLDLFEARRPETLKLMPIRAQFL